MNFFKSFRGVINFYKNSDPQNFVENKNPDFRERLEKWTVQFRTRFIKDSVKS